MDKAQPTLDEAGTLNAFASNDAWQDHVHQVLIREHAVSLVRTSLIVNKYDASSEIASTDIFVQKAEKDLNNRSKQMKNSAKLCAYMFPANILLFLAVYLIFRESFFKIDLNMSNNATQVLIAGIVKNSTFVGIFLASQYLTVSLYRAFMHEATTLENRVHSLRLGRLFIYLKYSSAKKNEISKIRDSISSKELGEVFGWNIETSTAFKDIDAKQVGKSIFSVLADIGAIFQKKS